MICHRVEAVQEAHGFLDRLPAAAIWTARWREIAKFKKALAPPDAFFRRRDSASAMRRSDKLRVDVLGPEGARNAARKTESARPVETLMPAGFR